MEILLDRNFVEDSTSRRQKEVRLGNSSQNKSDDIFRVVFKRITYLEGYITFIVQHVITEFLTSAFLLLMIIFSKPPSLLKISCFSGPTDYRADLLFRRSPIIRDGFGDSIDLVLCEVG